MKKKLLFLSSLIFFNTSFAQVPNINNLISQPTKNSSDHSTKLNKLINKTSYTESEALSNLSDEYYTPKEIIKLRSNNFKKSCPSIKKITIDPGHGGKDSGAIGSDGTLEKNITLTFAKKIQHHLKFYGFKVLLTRESDMFIQPYKRVMIARKEHPDLFLSLHADASSYTSAHGISLYTISESEAANQVNKLHLHRKPMYSGKESFYQYDKKTSRTLIDILQTSSKSRAEQYASFSSNILQQQGFIMKKRTLASAEFAVLKIIDIPAILIELGYLSNPIEEKLLNNTKYQDNLAQVISYTILLFLCDK